MVSTRLGFCCFDVLENFLAGVGIQAVEHFRHRADAAVRFAAELAEGFQLVADDAGDLRNDFRRDLIEIRHAQRHIGAHLGGKREQQARRLRRIQVRKNQRDGLRMFAVNKFGELLRIGLLQASKLSDLVPSVFISRSSIFLACSGPKALIRILRA